MRHPESSTRSYRPDIDGLRALAVLLVVFNHVGIRSFAGGFVGVDVFFVISGYLIGLHVLEDIRAGEFSIARFYQRRFRRIIPALAVMLLASSMLSYIFLFPAEFKSFAQTELGAVFSVSNIVLYGQINYFDPLRKLKPLLHTWSLGVEEQFYILFPLFMLGLVRWARRRIHLVLWALTIGCFYLADHCAHIYAPKAFFLAPYRAWELLCGVLLAAEALPRLEEAPARNLASLFGVFLILQASLTYDDTTVFPGMSALAPCLGTTLILAAGQTGTSVVGRVLSYKPLRWIGLISYSLYLWHWPIQVFQHTSRILVPDRAPVWESQVAVITASLAVAAISWRFVEQPFRTGRFRADRFQLFAINGTLLAVAGGFALFVTVHEGWLPPWAPRFENMRDSEAVAAKDSEMRYGTCYVGPDEVTSKFNPSICLAADPARKQYLVVGDSHSAHAFWALKTTFPEQNVSQFSVTGCIPTISQSPWSAQMCAPASKFLYLDYLSHHPVNTVILFARWRQSDLDYIQETTEWIKNHGMNVVIIGPSIEFDGSLLRLLELAHREHDADLLSRHRVVEPEELDRRMQALARDVWHVPYISVYEDLCAPQVITNHESAAGCPVYASSGKPLLWDTDHFSPDGALLFAEVIRQRHELP